MTKCEFNCRFYVQVKRICVVFVTFPAIYGAIIFLPQCTILKDTFQTIQNLSRPSGIFQTIQKFSRPTGNCPHHSEFFLDSLGIFQIIQKYFILSGNFPDSPQTFLTIRKLSRLAGNFLAQFQGYAKQISEWQCHDATIVFGPLLLTQYHFCK